MEQFLEFLDKAKNAPNCLQKYNCIEIVTGNESCDLDSTVSCLVTAYLLNLKNLQTRLDTNVVIPVLNVISAQFHFRTEVCYLLKYCNIPQQSLTFKDQIDYAKILNTKHVETTLVDHHVLSKDDKILETTVVRIFDHRPINNEEIVKNDNMQVKIKTVGSCATIVTQELMDLGFHLCQELYYLLYSTIIFDTIGLKESSGRTFPEDISAAHYLEHILDPVPNRKELFDTLYRVHHDISSLASKDILWRDVKMVQGLIMPGLPMLIEDFLKRDDAYAAIKAMAKDGQFKNLVLIGINATESVRRDIAVYYTDPKFKDIMLTLLDNNGKELQLTEIPSNHENIILFKQGNIRLTRKFILPIVSEAVRQLLERK